VVELLGTIDVGLKRLGRTATIQMLQPGLPASECYKTLETLELDASGDLATIYAWHNGTSTTDGVVLDDLHLFPGFYFLSLQEAVANYVAFKGDDRWDPSWLPVFGNGGGDFFVVVCDRDLKEWGQVVHFRIDESEHPLEFASIEAMLATVAAAYEEGVYYVDDRGYLEMDDYSYIALATRMNGDAGYWR